MKNLIFLAITLPLIISTAKANVTIGSYFPFAGAMQIDKEGGTSYFQINPLIMVQWPVTISGSHTFRPALGFAANLNTSENHSKNTFMLLYNFGYQFNSVWLIKYGAGVFYTRVYGEGGIVTLNNGSSFAEFYRPDDTAVSYNTTLDLGSEFFYNKNISFGLDFYVFGFTDSNKRQVSYSLTASYYL